MLYAVIDTDFGDNHNFRGLIYYGVYSNLEEAQKRIKYNKAYILEINEQEINKEQFKYI